MTITTERRLLHLLHLASPCLPVGAYAYSQGLEGAVDCGWVKDATTLEDWLRCQLHHSLARVDLPLLQRCDAAARTNDIEALAHWNATLLACRETGELRLGDTASGEALARLLPTLEIPVPALQPQTFLCLFGCAAAHWHIDVEASATAYAWIWLENQVIAATKLLPLGQTRAQELLCTLQDDLAAVLPQAFALEDDDIGASLPGLALASLHHETQYSRLFRS